MSHPCQSCCRAVCKEVRLRDPDGDSIGGASGTYQWRQKHLTCLSYPILIALVSLVVTRPHMSFLHVGKSEASMHDLSFLKERIGTISNW